MGEGEFGPVVLGVAHHIVPNQDKTLVAVKVTLSFLSVCIKCVTCPSSGAGLPG